VKVLVVGSGGREHALAWTIARSPLLTELHAAPGNPGIASLAHCHPVRAEDTASLAAELKVDLVVVGPEAPLVAGVADEIRAGGIAVFGPSAAMPGFPGAAWSSSTPALRDSDQTSACSRPPDPTTSTRMRRS